MNPRISTALTVTITLTLIIAFSGGAHAQTYIQYRIQLNNDQSATWTITQTSGSNGSVDTWAGFETKVTNLVNAAAAQTHRPMGVDPNSLQMTTSTSNDSKSTDYIFTWLNFSVAKSNQLVAGDVFGVNNFFGQLYGDGVLQIDYPANYTLHSVSPNPDQEDLSAQTLQWFGAQFFASENPEIVLTAQRTAQSDVPQVPLYLVVSISAIAAVAVVVVGWFFAANRRQKPNAAPAAKTLSLPETEQEKVLSLLRSSGGTAHQSAITEQLRFSKAKTSQLLSTLERDGVVRRVKKGRDKIVSLVEFGKGEK